MEKSEKIDDKRPIKASIAYTICSIFQKSLSFITMPLFTRLLTKAEYGQYTIYVSWSAILTIIITLNLAFGSFGPAMMKYEKKREEYVSSLQTIVLILAAAFLVIYLPLRSFINPFLGLETPLILLMLGEIVAQFSLQCWMGIQRYRFKYWPVVIVTLLMSILSPLLAYVLIVNSTDKGSARIIGYVIITIMFGLIALFYNYLKGKKIFSREFWGFALKFNLPLLAYYFSQVIFNQSDKIMIQHLLPNGESEAAVYGVGYSLALILTFVLNSINGAYEPWLFGSIQKGSYRANRKISIIITIIMCTLVGGIIWIAPELVGIMAGQDYKNAIYVIPPVSISLILLLFSQFAINIEFFYGEKWKLVAASIGAALLNIGLNFWLIPIYGIVSAGYTTLISYVVFLLCNYCAVLKHIGSRGNIQGIYNIWMLIIIFFGFVGLSYVGVLLYDFILIRYIIIGFVILVLIVLSPFFIKKYKRKKSAENVAQKYINEDTIIPSDEED